MTGKDVAAYLERHLAAAEEEYKSRPTGECGAFAYGWLSSAVETAIEALRDGAE